MSGAQEVRCTHELPHVREGYICRRKLANQFAGFIRTDCPKCHHGVKAVTPGRTEIEDGDGIIVVVVTREPRPSTA